MNILEHMYYRPNQINKSVAPFSIPILRHAHAHNATRTQPNANKSGEGGLHRPGVPQFSNLIFFVTDHLINISLIFLGQFQSLKKLLSGRPTNKPYVGKLVEVSKNFGIIRVYNIIMIFYIF